MKFNFKKWKDQWKTRRCPRETKREQDYRDAFDRDRARIIHSAAFRRLQAKTQVLGIGEGDFRRTRLTHSMEVAQIARGIVRHLNSKCKTERSAQNFLTSTDMEEVKKFLPSDDLIEAIGLAHDLGHPPFGHSGEIALNYLMRDLGGFEGNAHTLRLLAVQEAYRQGEEDDGVKKDYGLDLTRRTLLGIMKYPVPYSLVVKKTQEAVLNPTLLSVAYWKPPKCYFDCDSEIVDWVFEPFSENDRKLFQELKENPTSCCHGKSKHLSLDASILELADDIAYATHDLEDGVQLGLITCKSWEEWWDYESRNADAQERKKCIDDWLGKYNSSLASIEEGLFDGDAGKRKITVGGLINALICSVAIETEDGFEEPLLKWKAVLSEGAKKFRKELHGITKKKMIEIPQVQMAEFRGRHIVIHIFEAIASNPKRMLKSTFKKKYEDAENQAGKMRVICDYLAGMTDEYATKVYERLYVPRQGTVFDKL